MRDGALAVRAPCGIEQYVSIRREVSPYNSENKRQEVIHHRINNWTNIEMNTNRVIAYYKNISHFLQTKACIIIHPCFFTAGMKSIAKIQLFSASKVISFFIDSPTEAILRQYTSIKLPEDHNSQTYFQHALMNRLWCWRCYSYELCMNNDAKRFKRASSIK